MGHHSHSVDDNQKFAGIAILAALVGAVTALVLTPKTGRQTRAEIRHRVANTKEHMKYHLQATKSAATDEAKSAADLVDEAVMIGKEHIHEATKDKRPPSKGDAEDTADDIRKHGER